VRGFTWVAAFAALGCSSGSSGTLSLVTGEEDAGAVFEGVTQLNVQWVDTDAQAHSIVDAPYPTTSIDLGSLNSSAIGMIEVTGINAAGQAVLFGSTIPLQFGVLDNTTVSLFVQRMGETARMPSPPANDARRLPVLGTLLGRYLIATGGIDPDLQKGSELYDFLTLKTLPTPPDLLAAGQITESMAVLDIDTSVDPSAYLVSTAGITSIDLVTAGTGAPTPGIPASSFTAADIAGGSTVLGSDGARYIVGGTRVTHGPSVAVLKIDATNTPSWLTLHTPRMGAAALWIDAFGLVVIGGTRESPAVESIAASGTATGAAVGNFSASADPSTSIGAAALDGKRFVVVAGGFLPDGTDPGVRLLDLDCSPTAGTPCLTPWPSLPVPLVLTQVFAANPNTAIVVGSEMTTLQTHVFVVTRSAITEVTTKVPHVGGRAITNPLGTPGSILLYGGANEIESFVPLPP
jgi:hypothetical protein